MADYSNEQFDEDYELAVLFNFVYAIVIASALDISNERATAFVGKLAEPLGDCIVERRPARHPSSHPPSDQETRMQFDLDGQIAIVTGGTRGIGRAIAEAFVEAGANVVINGRSEEKGKQALAEIGAGDRAHFIAGDASAKADVEHARRLAVEHYGRLDILVNNAGGNPGHGLVEVMTDEVWLRRST